MNNNTTHDDLAALLKAERTALLCGDFDTITDLFEEKQALVARLKEVPIEGDLLEPLRDTLRRNQELFNHALGGFRNIINRLKEVSHVHQALNTYDAHGRAKTISAPNVPQLERRA